MCTRVAPALTRTCFPMQLPAIYGFKIKQMKQQDQSYTHAIGCQVESYDWKDADSIRIKWHKARDQRDSREQHKELGFSLIERFGTASAFVIRC